MKYRKKLRKKVDKRIFSNTANKVHSNVIKIGQRGGIRI